MSAGVRLSAKPFAPGVGEVKEWFDDALDRADPRPTEQAYERLARDIQIAASRHNNAIIEQQHKNIGNIDLPLVPLTGMADVSPSEWEQAKLDNVATQAGRALASLHDLRHALDLVEEFSGDHRWNNALTLSELRAAMLEFSPWLYGVGGDAASWRKRSGVSRGRPKSAWHDTGSKIGAFVKSTLTEAGYTSQLSLKNEYSAAVLISTSAVNWVFGLELEPSGFASAMRERSRTSGPNA